MLHQGQSYSNPAKSQLPLGTTQEGPLRGQGSAAFPATLAMLAMLAVLTVIPAGQAQGPCLSLDPHGLSAGFLCLLSHEEPEARRVCDYSGVAQRSHRHVQRHTYRHVYTRGPRVLQNSGLHSH